MITLLVLTVVAAPLDYDALISDLAGDREKSSAAYEALRDAGP